jgi:hypothetical protein
MKISGSKAAQALPRENRKVRKWDKNGKRIQKLQEMRVLIERWRTDDPTLTSAELAELHLALYTVNRARPKSKQSDSRILDHIERTELRKFDQRILDGDKLTLKELRRYRLVGTWQLKGRERERFLVEVDRMIETAEDR